LISISLLPPGEAVLSPFSLLEKLVLPPFSLREKLVPSPFSLREKVARSAG